MNKSLSDAESYLVDFYAQKANYSAHLLNATALGFALHGDAGNATLQRELGQANANVNASVAAMRTSLQGELASLGPFGVSSAVNTSDPGRMQQIAQDSYTNASNTYKDNVISALHSVLPFSSYSYEAITPTLGQFFLGSSGTR